VTARPGLVPDPLVLVTHAFISMGFWDFGSRSPGDQELVMQRSLSETFQQGMDLA